MKDTRIFYCLRRTKYGRCVIRGGRRWPLRVSSDCSQRSGRSSTNNENTPELCPDRHLSAGGSGPSRSSSRCARRSPAHRRLVGAGARRTGRSTSTRPPRPSPPRPGDGRPSGRRHGAGLPGCGGILIRPCGPPHHHRHGHGLPAQPQARRPRQQDERCPAAHHIPIYERSHLHIASEHLFAHHCIKDDILA